MEYAVFIILLALAQYLYFTARVGLARGKYGVKAPATSGNEPWERVYRVQQNTLEQLVIFIPAMIAFSMYTSNRWVLLPGVAFLIGRQLYSIEYIKDPDSRTPGMALSLLSNAALVIGALIGLAFKVF
jgi:glutathione S-transferase